jgi:hypothetical protein
MGGLKFKVHKIQLEILIEKKKLFCIVIKLSKIKSRISPWVQILTYVIISTFKESIFKFETNKTC